MTTDDLKQLLESRTFRTEFMEVSDGSLKLFLQDLETGQTSELVVEPIMLVLPDEAALDFSYRDLDLELGPPPEECLILDLKTRVGPDFEKGEMPSLFQ